MSAIVRCRVLFQCLVVVSLNMIFTINSEIRAQEFKDETLNVLELKRKSLEELMQVEVTSLSKKEERLFESAADVQVITHDDIRRTGAATIPEVLQLASNITVAQVDSRQWAISARGFNGTTSNKLLVLIDGRSVYTPLYSGIFWDVQHLPLDEIERIEIISGPGGSLWGANAINGIINIITRRSTDTSSHGLHITAGTGSRENGLGVVQYGGSLSEQLYFRTYGMYHDRKNTVFSTGLSAQDQWNIAQGGFRMDRNEENDLMTLQGDFYKGIFDQPVNNDIVVRGFNVLGRWRRSFTEESNIELQWYIDNSYRNIPGTFAENLTTGDIEFQHTFTPGENHRLIWGIGFRYMDDHVENTPVLAFLPPDIALRLFSGFVQDEISILHNVLRLTIGTKIENNDFTGLEFQPSARISWLLSNKQFLWGAVSRAVRTPSRIDRDFYVPGIPPYTFLAGGPGFKSENLIAYEIGFRQSEQDYSLETSLFYNMYDNLRSFEPGPTRIISNGLEGTTYGSTIVVNYQIYNWWRIKTGYTYLQKIISLKPWSRDINNAQGEGNDPKHVMKVHSSVDIGDNIEFETWLRLIDKLPNIGSTVPSVASLNMSCIWKISNGVSLIVIGQNVNSAQHPEFGSPANRKEIQRSVSGRIRWDI